MPRHLLFNHKMQTIFLASSSLFILVSCTQVAGYNPPHFIHISYSTTHYAGCVTFCTTCSLLYTKWSLVIPISLVKVDFSRHLSCMFLRRLLPDTPGNAYLLGEVAYSSHLHVWRSFVTLLTHHYWMVSFIKFPHLLVLALCPVLQHLLQHCHGFCLFFVSLQHHVSSFCSACELLRSAALHLVVHGLLLLSRFSLANHARLCRCLHRDYVFALIHRVRSPPTFLLYSR